MNLNSAIDRFLNDDCKIIKIIKNTSNLERVTYKLYQYIIIMLIKDDYHDCLDFDNARKQIIDYFNENELIIGDMINNILIQIKTGNVEESLLVKHNIYKKTVKSFLPDIYTDVVVEEQIEEQTSYNDIYMVLVRNITDIEGAYVVEETIPLCISNKLFDSIDDYKINKYPYINLGHYGSTSRVYAIKINSDGTIPNQDSNDVEEEFEYPHGYYGDWSGPMPGEVKLYSTHVRSYDDRSDGKNIF